MTAARENHREAVAGRSDVEDTAELLAYYDDLERLKAGALWTIANKIEPWEPGSRYSPVLWPYKEMRGHVLRAIDLVTPEKAGRRVIYLNNPGAGDRAACVGGIYSGLQVMKAGETASDDADVNVQVEGQARPRRPFGRRRGIPSRPGPARFCTVLVSHLLPS